MRIFKKLIRRVLVRIMRPVIFDVTTNEICVWGEATRLKISPKARMVNTFFNTFSGCIEVDEYTFTGHNVSILTGTHRPESFLEARMRDFPKEGNDVIIGRGVWIGSNAVILGPCRIGDHAVVAAGAVVIPRSNIPAGAIVAGVPAKVVRLINASTLPTKVSTSDS